METKKGKHTKMVNSLLTIGVYMVNKMAKNNFSLFKQPVKSQQIRAQKILVSVYALLLTTILTAQVYPVQVTPQLVPPYSLKLSDYETTSSEKLFVNVLLTDVNELGRQVRLKMYIEGEGLNIQTLGIVAGANPINLDGGINQRLSNLDLRPYFNFSNLLGITSQQYNASLPEGRYDFCFEVYDFVSGQQLSRKSCFSVYLILNEPPILNVPGNSDLVTARNPQNIIFNWTPRHLNATNVQYEYTLKELWDTKIDPQAAFLASPALHQEATFATTLLYGPANTQLLEGKTYGWQVRALVSDGISETSVFRNDGYSEIFYFNYVGDCDTPSFIISEAESSKTVKILWQYSDHIRYEIQYRKKGYGEDDWFSAYAYNQETTIRNLEEGTVYEFRVGGECTTNGGFAFSEIHEFTTPTEEEEAYYNCGIPPEIEVSNQEPLPKIGASETFTAGDFPVVVVEVSGGNGNFTGWGYITLPFLAKVNQAINVVDNLTGQESNNSIGKYTRIRVEFKGISINTDYQLTAGSVETSYDADWGGILSVDDLIDTIVGDEGDIANYDATNTNITDVIVNEAGNIILIDTDGNEIPIEVRKPVVITDSEGEQWTVNEDGTVTEGGYAAEGGAPTSSNTNGVANNGDVTQISSEDVTVVFKPSGFYDTDALRDEITDEKFTKNYETIPQASGGDYNVLYKALSDLPPNETDIITAEATFSNNKTKDDIVFKTKQGTKVEASWSGNIATINLKKSFAFAKDEILATVKPQDSTAKYDIAGKVNVWHLAQKEEINVTIVPVGENAIGENNTIKADLDAIYNPAGIKFNVTIEDKITISDSVWDVENDNDELDIGDSNTLANYTIEERALYNYYKEQRGVAEKMYYIFVLGDITTTDESIDGFMPLKRQYGFIFNKTTSGRTIAHELGHGIFGLEHPFNEYDIPQESTDLLMDYNNGTSFTQMDWQKIHEPGVQLYWFQGDEDGEFAGSYAISPNFKVVYINDSKTFSTKGAEKIITGTLPGFVVKSNDSIRYFTWSFSKNVYVNIDYPNDTSRNYNTSQNDILKSKTSTNLFYNSQGSCGEKAYVKLEYEEMEPSIKNITSSDFTEEQKIKLLFDLISKYTSTRTNQIACGDNDNGGWSEIVIDCLSSDIYELVSKDVEKIDQLTTENDIATIVKTINEINNRCVFETVGRNTYKSLLEKLITKNIAEEQEKAIVKILLFLGKDYHTELLSFLKEEKRLSNLFEEVDNTILYFFGENNENKLLNILGTYFSRLDNDQDKWYIINSLISSKYDDIDEINRKEFIHTLIVSMDEYRNKLDEVIGAKEFFTTMLIDDCKKLEDFKIIFDLAIDRFNSKLAFSSFTQGNKVNLNIPGLLIDTNCSISTPAISNSWSWIRPRGFSLNCGNTQIEYIYTTSSLITKRANDVFPWASYFIENENMDILFENNLVELINTFKSQFFIYIQQTKEVNENFWETITISCDKMHDIINHISINESPTSLALIDKEKRVQIIETYFKNCSIESFVSISFEKTDSAILKLFASFEKEDISILETIENIGVDNIFEKLSSKENSKTLAKVLVWMGGQIHNSGHAIELKEDMLLATDTKEALKSTDLLGLETNLFDFYNEVENFEADISGNKFKVNGKYYDYNQKAPIYVADGFEFLGQNFKKGDVLVMPMIQAFAMSNSNRGIVNEKAIWLAVDGVLLVVGIGEVAVFFKAGNLLRKAIVAVDLASTSAGMIENIVDSSSLSKEARFNLQMFALVTSIPSMVTSIKSVDNLVSKFDGEINAMNNLDQKSSLMSYVATLKGRVDLYSSFTDLLNQYNLLSKFESLSESLKTLFQKDFLLKPSEKVLEALKNNDAFDFWKKYRTDNPTAPSCTIN